jgi:CheY-like chemotaxis protein
MPVMDGIELIRSIRRLEAGFDDRLPVFALTAAATLQISDECKRAGADRVLTKVMEVFMRGKWRDLKGDL